MKSNTGEKPLQSWKEIGAYLQRNEVTVRRWEKEEGLPVHRHSHNLRSSVYAYPSEIDTWKLTRRALPARDAGRSWWRPVAAGLTTLLCLVMAGNGLHPQAVLAQSLTTRQIPMDGIYGLEPWSFSADGRWFATVEWTGPTNDLVLREVATGQRKVLQSGQCYGTPCAEADLPLLSPDLRQVAYNWYDSALPESRDPTREAQLRVIANEPGATPRVVAELGSIVRWAIERRATTAVLMLLLAAAWWIARMARLNSQRIERMEFAESLEPTVRRLDLDGD